MIAIITQTYWQKFEIPNKTIKSNIRFGSCDMIDYFREGSLSGILGLFISKMALGKD